MTAIERQRATERDELQHKLTQLVNADLRVEAAWLFGSFGRGDADAWSDLDVVIVVADDRFDEYLAERYDQVSRLGQLVLTFESAQNGPPGGCYLMAGYESPSGLMLVDWYWQPRRAARMANSKAVLVMREPIEKYENADASLVTLWQEPGQDERLALWNPTDEQDRANCGVLAWAMLAIQTKYVARRPTESGLEFQEFIENLLARASGRDGNPTRFGDAAGLAGAKDRLSRLEQIATELQSSTATLNSPAASYGALLSSVKAHCATAS